MNMMEYLERDKELLLRKLEDAGSMEKAEPVIREEFSRLLMQYNENCDEPYKREVASLIMQAAGISSGLVNSVGETRIWENINQKETHKNANSGKQKLFLAVGGVSGILSVLCAVFAAAGESIQISGVIGSVVLMAIAVLGSWFAGKEKSSAKLITKSLPTDYRTENRIDPQHVYTCMHNMIFAADQDLNRLELPDFSMNDNSETTGSDLIPASQISLFSELLEALYCEDGTYALDKLRNVKYYLHQNGIEVVTYDGTNKELFDFMPAMKAGTFRPALVSDGKVLKRGLASGGR